MTPSDIATSAKPTIPYEATVCQIILGNANKSQVDKFWFVGEFYLKEYATVRRGFFLSSAGQYLVFVGSDPFLGSMDLFQKNLFSAFRGFGSSRRRDGSVLEGTICKQFVMSVKNRKNLKPCRGFKSFRSLVFHIQFLKNRVFGSSNPSTRRKIENGSMEIRKKLGAVFSVGSKST